MSTSLPLDEQLWLFDHGLNISELRSRSERLMEVNVSPRTLRAYSHSWRNFERWCFDAGRPVLPAEEDSVSLFLTWCLDVKQYRLETVKLAISAIKWRHRESGLSSPVGDHVRLLVRSAARQRCEEPRGKVPITPEQVRSICSALGREPSLLDLRDRALLLVGFSSGCRRSELAAFQFSDLAFVPKGLTLRVRRSKVDQMGKGRVIGIPAGSGSTCPVRALRSWVRARGDWRGPLFSRFSGQGDMERSPIRAEAVNVAVKRLLDRVGVDSGPYGAHSLRAGMATAGAENGASELAIMQRGGWKSINTVLRYVRPVKVFGSDPLAGVL